MTRASGCYRYNNTRLRLEKNGIEKLSKLSKQHLCMAVYNVAAVMFKHCFIIELFGLMTAGLK